MELIEIKLLIKEKSPISDSDILEFWNSLGFISDDMEDAKKQKLALAYQKAASWIIDNEDLSDYYNFTEAVFPIIRFIATNYDIFDFDPKDLYEKWCQETAKWYNVLKKLENIEDDFDVDANVCVIFAYYYTCELFKNQKT